MVNRYLGNTGRVQRIPEPDADQKTQTWSTQTEMQKPSPKHVGDGLRDPIQRLMRKLSPSNLEQEDIILLLILFLLYRESGDREFLIALGAFLLL